MTSRTTLTRHHPQVEQWRPIVEKFFRPEDVEYAMMIMWYESRGKANAANPTSDARGLMQHLEHLWPSRIRAAQAFYAQRGINIPTDIYDPVASIAAAAYLLDHSGSTGQYSGWFAWTPTHEDIPPGSFGPNTYWNGTTYVNRGGGPTGNLSFGMSEFPYGGYSGSQGQVGLPAGNAMPTATLVQSILDLMADKMAGGQRMSVEQVMAAQQESQTSTQSQSLSSPTTDGFGHPLSGQFEPTGMFGDPRDGGSRKHMGTDFRAPEGTPVQAMRAGTVTHAGPYTEGAGRAVIIDHGDGTVSKYFHLSAENVRAGQRVSAGDVIGAVGDTGNSDGPHLHVEIEKDGAEVDPLTLIGSDFMNANALSAKEMVSPIAGATAKPKPSQAVVDDLASRMTSGRVQ